MAVSRERSLFAVQTLDGRCCVYRQFSGPDVLPGQFVVIPNDEPGLQILKAPRGTVTALTMTTFMETHQA